MRHFPVGPIVTLVAVMTRVVQPAGRCVSRRMRAFVIGCVPVVLSGLALVGQSTWGAEDGACLKLARELSIECNYRSAAVEFRRLALNTDVSRTEAGLWWMAAYEYWRSGNTDLSTTMLDRSEDADRTVFVPVMLLRAENSIVSGDYAGADFYLTSIAPEDMEQGMSLYVCRRRATAVFLSGSPSGAITVLSENSKMNAGGIAALRRYRESRDKKPLLGGTLGMVPGLGYAYAGEYSNALRCLILNSIFMFGMYATASEDQWGAFSVITFFEITWYTGSIYGGIDACHRYNESRRDACLEAVNDGARFKPDLPELPILMLRFEF